MGKCLLRPIQPLPDITQMNTGKKARNVAVERKSVRKVDENADARKSVPRNAEESDKCLHETVKHNIVFT